jgi:hypothetical protein
MRSKIARKILNETPTEVRKDVLLRGQIAAVLEDADAVDKIIAIINPMRDRIAELENTLKIEREYMRDMRKGECPF